MGACASRLFCCCRCCKKPVEPDAYEAQLPKFPPKPNHGRKCRDILGILLFAAFWVGMVVIASIGVSGGNAWRLLYGTDYKGNVCGSDKSEKLTAYPRFTEDLLVAAQQLGSGAAIADNLASINFFGVCANSCPKMGDYVCTYEADAALVTSSRNAEIKACKDLGYLASRPNPKCRLLYDECWYQGLRSYPYLFRCIPLKEETSRSVEACVDPADVPASSSECRVKQVNTTTIATTTGQDNVVYDQMTSAIYQWGQYFGDLMRTWYVVVVTGVVLSIFVSFLFIYLLKFFAGCIVWGILFLTVLLTAALALLFYIQAGIIKSDAIESVTDSISSSVGSSYSLPDEAAANSESLYEALAYVFTALGVLEIIFLIAARSAIKLGVGVLRVAGRALRDMPSMILCPVISAAFVAALSLYYIFIAAALYSMGDTGTLNMTSALDTFSGNSNDSAVLAAVSTFQYTSSGQWLQAYHFFGFLWTNQLFMGFTVMTLAGAVCRWYWVRRDESNHMADGEELASAKCGCGKCTCSSPLWAAFTTALRYHFGSIAIGSLLIAIVQFIRAVLAYVQRQLKQQGGENRVIRIVLCVLQSYLACFEKCLKFITRLAFVQIALYGGSFFSSAATVVGLVISNAVRVSVLNYVSFFLILLGKVVVTVGCAICSFLWLSYTPAFQAGGSDELASIWLPLLISALTAYAISSNIFYVYDVTIDTIFVCFLHDERIATTFQKAPFNRYLGKAIGIPAPKDEPTSTGKQTDTGAGEGEPVDAL